MICAVIALLGQMNSIDRLIGEGNRLQADQMFPEADSVYSEAIRKAEVVGGDSHYTALASNNRGASRYRAGLYAEALADYQNAHRIWSALGHPVDASKASTNLAELHHARGNDSEAIIWSQRAISGKPTTEALTIHSNILRNMGRTREALAFLETVVSNETPGGRKVLSLPLAHALLARAQVQVTLGLLDEADQSAQWAKEIMSAFRGPNSLLASRAIGQQAHIARVRGDLNQAERLLRELLRIQQAGLPDGHPQIAPTLVELAELLAGRHRFAEAEKLAQRAVALVREGLGESHPDYAALLLSLADLYRSQRQFDQAGRYYQDAIAHARAAGVDTQVSFASYLNNYATLLVDQNRFPEAEPLFRQALAIRERGLGPAHFQNAELLYNLAVVNLAQQQWTEAQALVERSLALKQQVVGLEHPSLTPALKLYGQLLAHNGQKKRAQEVARLCTRIEAGQASGHSVNWQTLRSFR